MNGMFDWALRHAAAIPIAGSVVALLTALYYWGSSKTFGSRRSGKYWGKTRQYFGNKQQLRLGTKMRNPDNLTHEGDGASIYFEAVKLIEYVIIGTKRYAILRSYVYSYRSYIQWKTVKGFGDNLMDHPPAEIFPGMGLEEHTDENEEKYYVKVPVPDVRMPEQDMVLE